MEKIKEKLKKIIDIMNSVIKGIQNNNDVKMLEKENYYIYKIIKPNMTNEIEINEENIAFLKEENAIFSIGGIELPIGSFEMQGNQINVKEEVTITPDGKMYMRGRQIC